MRVTQMFSTLFEAVAGGMLHHAPEPKGNRLMVRDEGQKTRHLRRTKAGKTEATPLLRGYHVDRSRYTGAMLRAIRAARGCGRPPKVLAARRAKAARRAAFPQAAA
ncbi:hypothetical protein [Xanthobacter autotrophicus]|uniref:hypothetical protein n=1 Tax=Xanthobacter autotrophicus TaxID=280 RepID=UPI00372C974D